MDLRYRVALRNYLNEKTPENAQALVETAMRAGVIKVTQESQDSIFGDYALAYVPRSGHKHLSDESDAWICRNDISEIFGNKFIVELNSEEELAPPDLREMLDAARDEGYDYLLFD